jgi:hypothetical protein
LHVTHTYRLLTRELSLPAPQMCAEACAARAGAQHTTRKHSRPRTHARMRGFNVQEPTNHRQEPRRALTSAEEATRCTSASGAVRHFWPKQGDYRARKVHQDRDLSRWRRCRRLAAARTMMDSIHEHSGLDGTDENQRDQQRITAILSRCRTPRQRRHGGQRRTSTSARRGRIRPSNGHSCPIRLSSLSWILDKPERQRGHVIRRKWTGFVCER